MGELDFPRGFCFDLSSSGSPAAYSLLRARCIILLFLFLYCPWARQMGAGLARFRIHSGPVGGPPLPQTLISAHCWLVHVEGSIFISVLRVSLTPLTDYLILPFTSVFLAVKSPFFPAFLFPFFASSRIPCSIYLFVPFSSLSLHVSSALLVTFCSFCEFVFVPTVLPPVLDTGSDEDLGRERFLGGWE